MRLDEIGQTLEAKVVSRRSRHGHGRAGALLAVAPMNPARARPRSFAGPWS